MSRILKKTIILLIISLSCVRPSSADVWNRWNIEIPLKTGEAVILRSGKIVLNLGQILKTPSKSRYPAYTASAWGEPSKTCASAVNAIHILLSVEEGKGRTISLVPSETIAPAATPGTAFVIEGKGGQGLFGGWAPPVGSKVFLKTFDDDLIPLSKENFKKGKSLLIVSKIDSPPLMVDIENRPGGRVIVWHNNRPFITGRVIRPVGGSGRFGGTLYQQGGRLRANHPGVIDISTSPYGKIGGFQIVPIRHGSSPEMVSMWTLTQWMIIGSETPGYLAGNPCLFKGYLLPGPNKNEQIGSLMTQYGRSTLVLCRTDGGKWHKLPPSIGRDDNSLKNITNLRIYFPNVID